MYAAREIAAQQGQDSSLPRDAADGHGKVFRLGRDIAIVLGKA